VLPKVVGLWYVSGAPRSWFFFFSSLIVMKVSRSSQGYGALHYAAAVGNEDMVSALVDAGFEIDARDAHGFTPLMWAANEGHVNTGMWSFPIHSSASF
jgi:ankyrin repeat protein